MLVRFVKNSAAGEASRLCCYPCQSLGSRIPDLAFLGFQIKDCDIFFFFTSRLLVDKSGSPYWCIVSQYGC